ncbi:DoxX family protein [Luteimonas gilva]|uniref:DoxX family protein n=1 Tax=Luteimonas gilva TaxID=2572684 RepID=A0A4U5JQK8_9GAMM|nr:DoxX family protein [Luteimonas gilva]TKR30881.1 DoxX family protein [Luteimonas gilva]
MNQAAQQDLGKLILRVVLGALILLHGIAKLRFGLDPIEGMLQSHGLPHFLAYGALVGEVLAPLLLILGWYGRVGAALIAVNMLFAFVLAHTGQLGQLNEQGGWALELQGMFLASSLALLLLGPGKYSVNQR